MNQQIIEREVLGDECAVDGCPYEHEGQSKYCTYHQDGRGLCENCGIQLMGDDVGYTRCRPCFDKDHAQDHELTAEETEQEESNQAPWARPGID